MVDGPAVFGALCLFAISGCLSVAEAVVAVGRSPRGGVRYLVAGFALDGVVATIAYNVLKVSLAHDFWGEPFTIYLAALFWGPLLLRVKLELLIPLNVRLKSALAIFSTVRSRLLDRVDSGATLYLTNWVSDVAGPAIRRIGYQAVSEKAKQYFSGLGRMSEDQKSNAITAVDKITFDVIDQEARESSLAWLVLKLGGKGVLIGLVQERKQ